MPTTDMEQMLKNHMASYAPAVYEGPLTIEQSALEKQLAQIASQQLAGEGLGLSPEEREMLFERMKQPLARERDASARAAMASMNRRGLYGSTIADQSRAAIERSYADALTGAKRDITLQDLAHQRDQRNRAMQMAGQLSQMDTARQQANIGTGLSHWQAQHQMDQMPWQMAMQYMSGVAMPREQMAQQKALTQGGWDLQRELAGDQLSLQKKSWERDDTRHDQAREDKKKASRWGTIGTIGGGLLGGLLGGGAGAKVGAGIGSAIGGLF